MIALSRLTAIALAASLSAPAFAEQSHHPAASAATAQTAQTQQPQAQPGRPMQPGMGPGPGMMGQGMGPGMTGQGGMMGGGIQGVMPMMGMMQMMHGAQHIEGRLAFAKTELKITSAQEKAWDDFSNAVRQAAAKTQESGRMMHAMSGAAGHASPIQMLEQHEKNLAARLEALRIVKPAIEPLYASFSDEQKQAFHQIHMIFHGVI
jgi:hypothetical protein